MKKEVMDALCMLHSLAKKDTTFTTQDEQFKIVVEYIENLQKENALLLANNNGYFGFKKYIENNYVHKDKIKSKILSKRRKALERYDSKLSIDKQIYKRNIQVAMLDMLLKELLDIKG